jgi:hypothetical protein
MPYKSQKQAAYMHIHHPEIAKRWDKEAESGSKKKKKKHSKAFEGLKKARP